MGDTGAGATGALARVGPSALALRSLDDMLAFAKKVVEGGLAPKGDNAASVLVKLQAGAELGFSPVQALSVMTAINGRVGIMGVGALARLRSSGLLAEPIRHGHEGDGDKRLAWIETRRRGEASAVRTEFSVLEAKRACLHGKPGPWTQFPDDMLYWRAVSRHCKRHWSDVLLGVDIAETIEVHPVSATVVDAAPVGPDPLLAALPAKPAEIATGEEIEVEAEITGTKQKGDRYGVTTADGRTYGTGDESMAADAAALVGQMARLWYVKRGEILELLSVEAV